MQKNVLIFGASGQDGYYLESLLNMYEEFNIIKVSRSNSEIKGDVSNFLFVESLIKKFKPTFIFHFAAQSTINHQYIIENLNAIVIGTFNILENVLKYSPYSKVFISGSALQFANNGTPINESNAFQINNSYNLCRNNSINIARYYRDFFNLKIYIGYLFNHDSFFRSDSHVNQYIITSVKKILEKKENKISLGNISIIKEFNYAGDIVNAIWIFINQEKYNEIVIGSGKGYKLQDWLNYCFSYYNLNWKDFYIENKNYKVDYKKLVSDPKKIYEIGWRPKLDIFDLADLMINNKF